MVQILESGLAAGAVLAAVYRIVDVPSTFLARPSITRTTTPSLVGHWRHSVAYQLSSPVTRSSGIRAATGPAAPARARARLKDNRAGGSAASTVRNCLLVKRSFMGLLVVARRAVGWSAVVAMAVDAVAHLKRAHCLTLVIAPTSPWQIAHVWAIDSPPWQRT